MQYCIKENVKKEVGKQGFSIIELMIVIMVGGLLAAMAFGGWKYLESAEVESTLSKMAGLDAAIENYSIKIGQYPKELTELVEGPAQNSPLYKRWTGALAKESELKDAWGRDFEYELGSKGSKNPYELWSLNKDGQGAPRLMSPASKE